MAKVAKHDKSDNGKSDILPSVVKFQGSFRPGKNAVGWSGDGDEVEMHIIVPRSEGINAMKACQFLGKLIDIEIREA